MTLPLTEKENEILAYIYGYISDNNCSPSRHEIAEKFKMSKAGADYFIGQLIQKNRLKVVSGKWRNIRIKEQV